MLALIVHDSNQIASNSIKILNLSDHNLNDLILGATFNQRLPILTELAYIKPPTAYAVVC